MNNGALYEKMFTELEGFEKKGVCILIDEKNASPMQVVNELMARETGSYMRDYEWNPEGHVESLSFINVNSYEDDGLDDPLLSDYQKNV